MMLGKGDKFTLASSIFLAEDGRMSGVMADTCWAASHALFSVASSGKVLPSKPPPWQTQTTGFGHCSGTLSDLTLNRTAHSGARHPCLLAALAVATHLAGKIAIIVHSTSLMRPTPESSLVIRNQPHQPCPNICTLHSH